MFHSCSQPWFWDQNHVFLMNDPPHVHDKGIPYNMVFLKYLVVILSVASFPLVDSHLGWYLHLSSKMAFNTTRFAFGFDAFAISNTCLLDVLHWAMFINLSGLFLLFVARMGFIRTLLLTFDISTITLASTIKPTIPSSSFSTSCLQNLKSLISSFKMVGIGKSKYQPPNQRWNVTKLIP